MRGNGPYCNKHRQRAAKYGGDPLGTPAPHESTLAERMAIKVASPNEEGCRPYTGATQHGYGVITETTPDGAHVTLKAHRVAFEQAYGPIEPGYTVDHECHNLAYREGRCSGGDTCRHRACCEPTHLVPRLMWDNVSRGGAPTAVNARKEQCPRHEVAYIVYRVCPCCRDEAGARHRERIASF